MNTHPILASLGAADEAEFVAVLGDIFENAPWIARAAFAARPFAGVDALHAAMVRAMRSAPAETQLALVMAYPELAGKQAEAGTLTGEPRIEQSGAGLDRCSAGELALLRDLNRRYRDRFGFPFIMAIRGRSKQDVLDAMQARLHNESHVEFERSLAEIESITRLRLAALLESS